MFLVYVFSFVSIELVLTANTGSRYNTDMIASTPRTVISLNRLYSFNSPNDTSSSGMQPNEQPQWQYDNDTYWPGHLCKEGRGTRQSPINIRTVAVVPDAEKVFIKYGELKMHGYQSVLVSGVNNGRTIQFTMEGDEAMHPSLSGGPLNYLYRLEQVHFHWLSEHAVDGYKYPMEIHFVHIRADLVASEALRRRDGMAIVAVFVNIKSEAENDDEFMTGEALEEVMRQLPHLTDPGDRVSGIVLNLLNLLSSNQAYMTYAGSLTSPECNEVVTWIILENPIFMTYGQFKDFSTMSRTRYNFRRLQNFNLTVYRPSLPRFARPVIFRMFGNMIQMVTDFVTNMYITAYNSRVMRAQF